MIIPEDYVIRIIVALSFIYMTPFVFLRMFYWTRKDLESESLLLSVIKSPILLAIAILSICAISYHYYG